MTEPHAPADHHDHHAGLFRLYMAIALALAVCTAASFLFNSLVRAGSLAPVAGFALILGVAFIKAFLVGYVFMHLKWDWRMLYFLMVPVFILGTMMIIILMPDIFVGPERDAADALKIAQQNP